MNRQKLVDIIDCWEHPHTAADIIIRELGCQPMDTAPKDGREILVKHEGIVTQVRWGQTWVKNKTEVGYKWLAGYFSFNGSYLYVEDPEAWAELPELRHFNSYSRLIG